MKEFQLTLKEHQELHLSQSEEDQLDWIKLQEQLQGFQ
jgi:hypothetical protein